MKEPCNLIGEEHVLVCNLKLCFKLMEKKALGYLGIKYSFSPNYFLPMNAPEDYLKRPLVSLGMAGHARANQPKRSSLTCYLSLVDISMQKNQRN